MSDDQFSPTEPGVSHPLTRCAMRLSDDGRLFLMAGDHAGIVLDEQTGVVTIYATEVRFLTSGVKVNGKRLSDTALIPVIGGSVADLLRKIDGVAE